MSAAAINVEDLTVAYGEQPALWDVDVVVPEGTLMAVVGPNGAGKTTLIRAILGLVSPVAGRIEVFGRPYEEQRRLVAYVPQRTSVDWDFPTNVLDVVTMGRYGAVGWLRRPGRRERDAALAALERVGMAAEAARRFGTLSGGQRQRVLVARAIVAEAAVLLLDEPLSGVDAPSAQRLEAVFGELRAEGRILLVATHDVTQARRWDAALCLNGRQVAFGAPDDVLSADVLRETYGGELVLLDGRAAIAVSHHAH